MTLLCVFRDGCRDTASCGFAGHCLHPPLPSERAPAAAQYTYTVPGPYAPTPLTPPASKLRLLRIAEQLSQATNIGIVYTMDVRSLQRELREIAEALPDETPAPTRADRVRAAFTPGYKTGCYSEDCSSPNYDVGLEQCPACGAPNLNFKRYAPESSEKTSTSLPDGEPV